MAAAVGNKGGSIGLLSGKAFGVVHAVLLLRDDIAVVTVIMQPELHVPHIAAVVRKLLENVNAVGVDMAAILEGIKVSRVGTLPGQHDLVGVVGITHLGGGSQGGGVSNTHGAVGVPTLHAVGMHGGRLVDLAQTGIGHADGHGVSSGIIGHGELAGVFRPGGDLVGAASVLEELDDHVVLVVADALAQRVHIGVLAQRRSLGGNRGQGADDLVVHNITHGCGSSMFVTVLDVGQAAGVLAGGVLGLTHGLIQRRIAGLVLGVDGNIVIPRRAVNGSHGQRHKEGVAGAGDILRDASLHDEIQALLHIGSRSVAGGIRFGHSHTAVLHGGLQCIFHGGGIGSQRSGQLVVQHIAGEVVDAALSLASVRGGQTDGGQHVGAAVGAVEAIQYAHLTLAVHHFVVHGNISNADISEFYALNGVFAQLIHDGAIMQAGGNVGFRIPRTLRAGSGDVVLVDGKGGVLCGVDGRFCERCGDEAQSHNNGHEHGQYAMDLFHLVFSFISIFLQKQTPAMRASAANRI